MTQSSLISTHGLSKEYPGVKALDSVDFDLRAGEVHVLFGENGAGKSTLISLLAGANTPTSGEIRMNGAPMTLESVSEAQERGIFTVFQEFSLIPTMSVAENIFLGREPKVGPLVNHRQMRREAARMLAERGFDIDPTAMVAQLPRAQQQMVEIAKAFHGDVSVLILDEPTASLSNREVDHLFDFVLRMKAAGIGIIYISHRINEFARIADRVTVLRDGAKIDTVAMDATSDGELIAMMAGREISDVYPAIAHNPGEVVLEVEGLEAWGVHGVDLQVRRGEILGVAGLVGSGKSRLFRAIAGVNETRAGRVRFQGRDITGHNTRAVMQAGLYYLTSDRKTEGLILPAPATDNLAIDLMMGICANGPFQRHRAINREMGRIFDHVELHQHYRNRTIAQLSGGNQQKVLFAKSFCHGSELYILDEPTVGVDMGTRAALYRLIAELAEAGKAVVVISSDLPEVMNLANRVVVMANGHVSAELSGDRITETEVLKYFFQETGADA
ncbi:MAG: ABC-type ribose uptake system ATPase component RbsA [Rhodobacteraceae bacterium HLUCCA12]|nr:MAG: ABC-type ribose uptake system ATPase component RbsA [Rhodobacteraceae bacterium HLUCCA12]